jgi:hypothetical protein
MTPLVNPSPRGNEPPGSAIPESIWRTISTVWLAVSYSPRRKPVASSTRAVSRYTAWKSWSRSPGWASA